MDPAPYCAPDTPLSQLDRLYQRVVDDRCWRWRPASALIGERRPAVSGACLRREFLGGADAVRRRLKIPALPQPRQPLQRPVQDANPLLAFIEDETVADPKGHTVLRNFREAMTVWATGQGMMKPVPYKRLKRQLEGLGYEVKMIEGYNRVYGLTLKP